MIALPFVLALIAPTPEAYELGRQVAATGLLTTLGPLQAKAEIEDLIKAHPELTEAEQAQLRAIGDTESKKIGEQILHAEATAYAEALSADDLQAIVNWQASPAATAQRQALPIVIGSTMKLLGGIDFKGTVTTTMCRDSGKLCAN